ncbi:hypothetical protein BOTNAR_0777g00010 [Botryotinia narcissicola]|uniref:Carboxylesterase type B domain-containing protein n=1 Tax=Botryotinia narcissicola TaxID=278944 RepID=A0A4Z1H7L3_9HELO|nr:hypothetical protein BOTNAR_0777g00010 [Botryotinia narcissicola]
MKQIFIRPVLDGEFISKDLFTRIFDGSFGKRFKELGIKTIIGDLTQEHQLYKNVFPPHSYERLIDRLSWDYPRSIAKAVCAKYKPDHTSPNSPKEYWIEIFGKLYADMQIHSTMRGFLVAISSDVPIQSINRYRIDWRTESVDKRLPRVVGATHGTDMSIWFFGNGDLLNDNEKVLLRNWLKPMADFIQGNDFIWGTRSIKEIKFLTSDGNIQIRNDDIFPESIELWNLSKEVIESRNQSKQSKI